MLPAQDATVARMMNENLFFSFFFASGRTLDTEELCLMTSRSPRYYVSVSYTHLDVYKRQMWAHIMTSCTQTALRA